jgi:rhodanese-related sulfurtransferase
MGTRAQAEFDFLAAKDGDNLDLGRVRLQILETPGHTPEGISLLVFDDAQSSTEPQAVLTGDTLFIGDVGRPDLLASIGVTADELADMLYHSLNRLRALPDSTLVYPAHGAGSMCGKSLSKETVSTMGEQKRFNYALQPMELADFKRLVTSDQPEAPDYFVYDAIKNRQERADLATALGESMRPLTAAEVVRLGEQGAQLVDVREGIDFEGAHLAGAINVGLHGKYATWCGSMLDHERPIVVIADEGSEEEAVMRLGRIGFDNVAGFLRDGMRALEAHPEWLRTVSRITAPALAQQLSEPNAPLVLDVRAEREWQAGHIPGSHNIPLTHLRDRLAEVPADRPVVVHCEGGYRSAIAASVLAQAGVDNTSDLVGGYKAWLASKLPSQSEAATVPA